MQGGGVGCSGGEVWGARCTVARIEVTNGNMEADSWPSWGDKTTMAKIDS